MQESVAILCGGGPAPGINTVISSISRTFLQENYRVIGVHQGYKGLLSSERNIEEIDFKFADRIHNVGGSALQMSRYKPKDEEFNVDFFVENNVKLLVTIGGDDTASTANRISEFLREADIDIQNIHVPKTIDNDLPLPEGISTFGYQSAKEEGVRIANTVYEDARTSGNWFVISAMGREAGHLAFGIGSAVHFPMIIIPEMFNNTEITVDKIIRLMVSSVLKRKMLGVEYGAVIVSEGVFHFLSDEEIKNTGINFTYDAHGHPELGTVSKAHIFNILLTQELEKLGIPNRSRPQELGYELRCVKPVAYDLVYCGLLGMGVKRLFKAGHTACMVTVDNLGTVSPLFLSDVKDAQGKIKPRLVNMDTNRAKMVFEDGLQYIGEGDLDAAKELVDDPSHYNFKKILNWK